MSGGILRRHLPVRGLVRLAAGFLLVLSGFSACMGGTGTDTENGLQPVHMRARVVDSSGVPVAGVELELRHAQSRPDSGASPAVTAPRTDAHGFTSFTVRQPGVYMAEGRLLGIMVILDTVRAFKATERDTARFLARAPESFNGSVRLKSGYLPDEGTVFLRGTSRFAPILPDGTYDLGLMPPEAAHLEPEIRFRAHPRGLRFVQVSGEDSALLEEGRIGLLGDADSTWATCLLDSLTSTAFAFEVNGHVEDEYSLAQIVSNVCPDLPGMLIRVEMVGVNDAPKILLGEYVRPDDEVFPNETPLYRPVALPAACIHDGASETRMRARFKDGEIRVNDIRRGQGCLE